MAFARFMASFWGRALRVIVGAIIIWWGLTLAGVAEWIAIVVGSIFVLVGLFNVCLIAPFLGVPFRGKDLAEHETPQSPSASPSDTSAAPPEESSTH